MRLKVLKYDKQKARSNFILLKLGELFGLFLLIFGFETLGRFLYYKWDWLDFIPVTYMEFWLYGFLSLGLILLIAFSAFVIGYTTIYILIHWVKLNWFWAKRAAEDEDAKLERLSEQKKLKKIKKIEELEEDRKKYGYCIGDTTIRIEEGEYSWEKIGDKGEIVYINNKISFDAKFKGKRDNCLKTEEFKFIKKKLDKKPKLNKVREEEVKEHGS